MPVSAVVVTIKVSANEVITVRKKLKRTKGNERLTMGCGGYADNFVWGEMG